MSSPTFRSVRRAFLAGAIVLAPLAVTVWVFSWLIGVIGGPGRQIFERLLPESWFEGNEWLWTLVAAVLALLCVTVLGYLSSYVAGRFLLGQTERIMQRVPLIGAVYKTSKQIIATFSAERRAVFEKVVLIEFPRPGCYAIGFLTSREPSEMAAASGEELWNIFVPTTPNPTSGFLVLLPRRAVTELRMSIGEGMKLIISGGAVVPPWPPAEATAADPEATASIPSARD